jgi:hypothetical protein
MNQRGRRPESSSPYCPDHALTAVCPCALALNPSHDINQYVHTAWTVRADFFDSAIFRIAQTPDGLLWFGSEFGLFRFHGVRSLPWQPPAGQHLPNESVYCLFESAQWNSLDWRVPSLLNPKNREIISGCRGLKRGSESLRAPGR